MAFFKFRTGAHDGPEESDPSSETRTVENLRRRARQRLIGAAVLVVLAVAGFPMVFDTQPRPVPSDLAIDIPSKAKQNAEVPPPPLASNSGAQTPDVAQETPVAAQTLSDKEEWVESADKATPHKAEVAKTEPALPVADKVASEAKFVVQVGSFLEESKVREARAKLEKAGLKTYTQVVDAKDGKRTRVRLGPFTTKAEAEKAAEKVKSLQMPALVLSF
jgi:DedD protein